MFRRSSRASQGGSPSSPPPNAPGPPQATGSPQLAVRSPRGGAPQAYPLQGIRVPSPTPSQMPRPLGLNAPSVTYEPGPERRPRRLPPAGRPIVALKDPPVPPCWCRTPGGRQVYGRKYVCLQGPNTGRDMYVCRVRSEWFRLRAKADRWIAEYNQLWRADPTKNSAYTEGLQRWGPGWMDWSVRHRDPAKRAPGCDFMSMSFDRHSSTALLIDLPV
ncbi:hypothetical protein CALVIDRAFT_569834 [Calocera viscosa TUFC12733]|uniref:Uncharacterized protein n=1 Tax=Calocera viscosa (strain TUFC12733) TaxID=1330018 RepID=A0A167FJA3_CALVF|nr:hypothetical protein CALVIDRAFT_569834 [Calocera viscosa TUFC12733]